MPTEMDRYRALWADVLWTAVGDACGFVAGETSNPTGRKVHQDRARDWFGSRDFETVAQNAGLNPDAVLEKVRPILQKPLEERRAWFRRASRSTGPDVAAGGRPQEDGDPITIRGRHFASEREAARHYRVGREHVRDYRARGKTDMIGLGKPR